MSVVPPLFDVVAAATRADVHRLSENLRRQRAPVTLTDQLPVPDVALRWQSPEPVVE